MTSRSMLSLPALTHGTNHWQLPMCDATALTLASAATENSIEHRATLLTTVLAVDPALAIWAVWQSSYGTTPGQQIDSPKSIAQLANWLAPRLLQLLDWKQRVVTIEVSAEQHGRFAALVAESVASAQEAVRLADEANVAYEPAYLAALTSSWQQWLAASQVGEELLSGVIPQWPLESLATSSAVTPDKARAAGDEAWRRWLSETPHIQSLLPNLVGQLRRLVDLDRNFEERLQTAKLDALKEFAYGAGHELNNPLANIASRAQTLLKEEDHPERRRRLAAINTQAFRAHEMLADMMLFARPPQPMLELVDLVTMVDEVIAGLSEAAVSQQTALHGPTRREPLLVEVDVVQLRIALRALCTNSLEALNQGGNITIELYRSDHVALRDETQDEVENDVAQISLIDDGPGIAPEIQQKIFDPFFSGREAGRGLGFGLPKCWRIVTMHGGRLDVHSAPGQGATMTISLPLASAAMSGANS